MDPVPRRDGPSSMSGGPLFHSFADLRAFFHASIIHCWGLSGGWAFLVGGRTYVHTHRHPSARVNKPGRCRGGIETIGSPPATLGAKPSGEIVRRIACLPMKGARGVSLSLSRRQTRPESKLVGDLLLRRDTWSL